MPSSSLKHAQNPIFSSFIIQFFSKPILTVMLLQIRDTKRTFHAKIGTIKDRNGMDLTEAEDIKNR